MEFILSGIDEESNDVEINIKINERQTQFKISNYDEIVIANEEFFGNLIDYNDNYGAGNYYLNRKYFLHFRNINKNKCIINMLRAFAVSSSYLSFYKADKFNKSYLDFKIETIREHFNNRLLLDWTGDMGTQPQMYFLEQDFIGKNKDDLMYLYNLRLLQKYTLIEPEKIECFYVPFDLPNVNNFQVFKRHKIWKTIVAGINNEIERLTNNERL